MQISVFAADGTMLLCSAKGKPMKLLEKLTSGTIYDGTLSEKRQLNDDVGMIVAMAESQSLH